MRLAGTHYPPSCSDSPLKHILAVLPDFSGVVESRIPAVPGLAPVSRRPASPSVDSWGLPRQYSAASQSPAHSTLSTQPDSPIRTEPAVDPPSPLKIADSPLSPDVTVRSTLPAVTQTERPVTPVADKKSEPSTSAPLPIRQPGSPVKPLAVVKPEIKTESGSESSDPRSVKNIDSTGSESSVICLGGPPAASSRLRKKRTPRGPSSEETSQEAAGRAAFIDDQFHSRKRALNKLEDCQLANPLLERQACWTICIANEHEQSLANDRTVWDLGACPVYRGKRPRRAVEAPPPTIPYPKVPKREVTDKPVKEEYFPESTLKEDPDKETPPVKKEPDDTSPQ